MAKKAVTVQKASDTTPHMGGFTLPISFFSEGNIAPEWEAGDRDYFLRTFWKRFGNDMLQGVIATAVAKVQTQNWQLEGPKRLVQMYHRFLRDEADFHRGYDSLVSRGLQDYYTQDNGWFIERFRASKRDKSGPALGFAHLDSQRMRATGNVEYPWYYEDVGGKYHLMHRSQFIRIVDLPTPATEMWSDERGFCALSRTLSTAMILTMIVAMKREKLADLPPSALAIFNNISRKQFENSLRLKGAEDDMANNMLYRQLLPLFGIDPAHPASVQFLSLREVWEGFSDEEAMNMAAYSFAAGFRMDPREFWPVSQGTLGTGKEAEVQHQKAKGKGHGLLFTNMERGFNANDSLPKNVKFKFAIQDADEEEQRAKIHSMQIGNIEGMQKAGAGLVPAEVRYLLVKKYKVIPQELLVPPVEGEEPNLIIADVYMDDVERQAKEYGGWYFGPVVIMDQDGSIYRKAAWDSARKELPDGPLFIGNVEPPSVVMGQKGGPGSGNWGHTGRPGQVGGSGGGTIAVSVIQLTASPKTVISQFEEAGWENPANILGTVMSSANVKGDGVTVAAEDSIAGWKTKLILRTKFNEQVVMEYGSLVPSPKQAHRLLSEELKERTKEVKASTKELTLQTLTKEFPCCDSHAAQEFPKLIDNLQELGYISTEEAYASELMPSNVVASIATGLKQTGKQGDDLLIAFVREFRHKLGLREYAVNEKAHKGLATINEKITKLPRAQAMQVRKASAELFNVMSNEEGNQRIKNIPQDVWDEAERLDLQESQLEISNKGGPGSGNWGHAGRPGQVGGSGGSGGAWPSNISKYQSAKLQSDLRQMLLRDYLDDKITKADVAKAEELWQAEHAKPKRVVVDAEDAINMYTENSPVNISLREGSKLDDVESQMVKLLDGAMAPIEADSELYRFVTTTNENYESIYGVKMGNLKIGSTFSDAGYASTSTDRKNVRKFVTDRGNLWRIHASKGDNALDLTGRGNWGSEGEILLPRNTQFRVLGFDTSGRLDVIDLEIVN